MESIVTFIKDFKLSTYGVSTRETWIAIGVVIAGFILVRWLTSFFPKEIAGRLKRALSILFYVTFYGIFAFIILNALLNEAYGQATRLLFCAPFHTCEHGWKSYSQPMIGLWINYWIEIHKQLVRICLKKT